MNKNIRTVAVVLLFILLIAGILGCTNSKPLRAEETVPIYCSLDSLYFGYKDQNIQFYLKYTGESSPLAWHISSQPGWIILQPGSGYLTYEIQYLNASINSEQLYYMDYGTYRGSLIIATSEGNKNIPVVFKYISTNQTEGYDEPKNNETGRDGYGSPKGQGQ